MQNLLTDRFDIMNGSLSRVSRILAAALGTCATMLGQAAAEYALRAGRSASVEAGSTMIAGCAVDSAVFKCLSHGHPKIALVVGLLAGLLVIRTLGRISA